MATNDVIVDSETIAAAQRDSMRRKARYLDKMPKTIKIEHTKPTTQYSITQMFVLTYNNLEDEIPEQECIIDLQGEQATCEYVPFLVLKALILVGYSKDPELSKVCASLFKRILSQVTQQTDHGNVITKDNLEVYLSTLQVTTYYAKRLVEGICITAFPKKYLKLHWRQVAYCGKNKYNNAIAAGERWLDAHPEIDTVKKLDKELATAYTNAKKEKGFMHIVNKDIATKPLIGMMFLTFITDSTVLVVSNEKDSEGFM